MGRFRLVALKGITNSLARRYGLSETDYTAGLWKPWLPLQLLWAREKGVSCFREDREHECRLPDHFPSWSWASCPGEAHFVQLNTGSVRPFIRLDDVQAYENTGRTTEPASLVLRGRLIPTKLMFQQITKENHQLKFQSTALISIFSTEIAVEVELDRSVPNLSFEYYLLPVLQSPDFPVIGLVLDRKGVERDMRRFCRIGIFYCEAAHLKEFLFISDSVIGRSPGLEALLNILPPIVLL